MFSEIIHIIDILLWIFVAGSVFYVALFALASLFPEKKETTLTNAPLSKFLILFPAYNEDKVIINSVEQFLQQTYPKENYQVVVISDHMQPETNRLLSTYSITLLTPTFEKSSKAKAMQYAINNIVDHYDYVVILDADNIVSKEFLLQLNNLCQVGYQAIQCHRCAKNSDNDIAVLDGVSEEINNTLFRKAHNNIRLSSALIGSGMCFQYELFKKNVFDLKTAGEDREMEALLLSQKVFIKYAPDIYVYDEKVKSQTNFQRQRMRWMTAQVQSLLSMLPQSPKAIANGNINYIDKTIQQALIPRSILITGIGIVSLLTTLFAPTWCIKWWILFGVLAVSLFIAIPPQLRIGSFSKILTIPILVMHLLSNILHINRKDTDFIHTPHG